MEEDFRIQSSVLADLGPLTEVVESNSDTVWQTFLRLEAGDPAASSRATSRFGSSFQEDACPCEADGIA